jgi:hypothetical protein
MILVSDSSERISPLKDLPTTRSALVIDTALVMRYSKQHSRA